jgi:thymidylate synthase
MEMGILTHSNSMQQLDVTDNPDYDTKEIINYSYCLQDLGNEDFLFVTDPASKEWAKAELQERLNPGWVPSPGEAWKLRYDFWKPLVDAGNFGYTYNNRMQQCSNVDRILDALEENPDSRQLILSIWDRQEDIYGLGGAKRVPCSIYYQFLLRENKLHIIYAQRSADAYNHLGNDIWLAYRLMEYMVMEIRERTGRDIRNGYLYHNIGSLHVYRKDWERMRITQEVL